MRRLRLSPAAQADLSAIWDYTSNRWGAAQANRYISLIRSRAEALAEGTTAARRADHVRRGYVMLSAGSHTLWCQVTQDSVDIIRILHQSMDVHRHL
jgi:toxin ParE1/3/4